MGISSINPYVKNSYSTGQTNRTQSTQDSSDTTKIKGEHHHHHHTNSSKSSNTTTNSENVQTNGTDTLELSSDAKKAVSNQ